MSVAPNRYARQRRGREPSKVRACAVHRIRAPRSAACVHACDRGAVAAGRAVRRVSGSDPAARA